MSSSPETPSPALLSSILTVATAAAREAGSLILAHRGAAVAVDTTKASFQDLVTATDKACEAAIIARVCAAFPAHAFLGEESVAPGRDASIAAVAAHADDEWTWVVDPIDGTTNFVAGLPLSVVSIGVAHRGVVVVAVILEPDRDELFTAVRGSGAFLNGQRLCVALTPNMRAALFGFGTHNNPLVGHAMMRAATGFVDAARGLRALGSAAVALAYVAAGRLGGYFEQDLNAWDLAAGALLIEEAGGRVTDMRGRPFSLATRDVLASSNSGGVHEAALAILEAANANSSDDTYARK